MLTCLVISSGTGRCLADIRPIIYSHIHIWQYPTTIPPLKKKHVKSNELNMTVHTHIWEQVHLNILLEALIHPICLLFGPTLITQFIFQKWNYGGSPSLPWNRAWLIKSVSPSVYRLIIGWVLIFGFVALVLRQQTKTINNHAGFVVWTISLNCFPCNLVALSVIDAATWRHFTSSVVKTTSWENRLAHSVYCDLEQISFG